MNASERMVTTIVSMKKIELNFKDSEPEAEELTAERAVAHILANQNTAGRNNETCRDSGNCGARVPRPTCTSVRRRKRAVDRSD